jgi:fluoride exporter
MLSIKNILLVATGGALGSVLRYVLSLLINATAFPYGTLVINIVGSFCIGMALAYCNKLATPFADDLKLLLATGICGGFTTFSAFSAENVHLLKQQQYGTMLLYMVLSVGLCISLCFLGFKIIK